MYVYELEAMLICVYMLSCTCTFDVSRVALQQLRYAV